MASVRWVTHAALAVLLLGCASSKPIRALRSMDATRLPHPIRLAVSERGQGDALLYQYQELCNYGETAALSVRLQALLTGTDFKRTVPGVGGRFTETYRNPFLAVADTADADMVLLVLVHELSYREEQLTGKQKASQVMKAALSGPLVQPDTYRPNSISLECTLVDRASGRSVYHFAAKAAQDKGLWGGGASFGSLLGSAEEELVSQLLSR